jgi:alanyl aminopeptidase
MAGRVWQAVPIDAIGRGMTIALRGSMQRSHSLRRRAATPALACSLLAAASACSQRSRVEATRPASPPATAASPAAPAAAAKADAPLPIFRLPGDVHPTRQRVELEVVPERESFTGEVEIELQLDKPRDDLWISSRELTLTEGALVTGGETLPLQFQTDDARGAARLVLPRKVAAGKATLTLAFRGAFNPHLVGLYRVKVGDRWYAYTQFEAIDARRAFPCFDEPAFKIPWEMVLTVPKQAVAVSNSSVVEETASGEMKRLRYRTTRPLPTYLIALAVGDFDVVTPPPLPPNEIRSRPLQVRGLAPKGRGGELGYALKAGGELLVMLERWFGTEYPYEKLDHIAVPDFEYGAMENVGLITYREPLLLVDPKKASEEQKLNVAVVITHEVAHQWFGDLVTMKWWDDLWLNESFASVMEIEIASAWARGNRYDLSKLREVHGAMATDELSSVRPIRPQLRTEVDIFGFDYQIAYDKGTWVVGMFQHFLGQETFRAGIRRYLAAHTDGNATRDDLIAALSAEGTDITAAMRSFIDQPGIPLVEANLRCDQGGPRVALKQSRQLPLGSSASRDVRWSVPVCVRSAGVGKPDCMLLDTVEAEMPLKQKTCPAWIALNPGAKGYYRWTLPPDQLSALLKKGYKQLSPAERLSLASNLSAGFRSGALSADTVLAAMGPLARDPEPAVAQEPGDLLGFVRDKIVDPSRRAAVQAHIRALYSPVLARLGWKGKANEPARTQSFRPWLIDLLAFEAGDRAVLERAAALGRAYIGTDGEIHPDAVDRNLTAVAVKAAGRLGSAELFDTMLQRLDGEEDSNVREYLLVGLSQFTDPQLAERARALAFDDRLRTNERLNVLGGQVQSPELQAPAWAWLRTNFDKIAPRVPPAYVQFLTYARNGCSAEAAAEIEAFFKPRVGPYMGAMYTLGKAIENTRLCAAQAAAQRQSATAFFSSVQGGRGARATAAP